MKMKMKATLVVLVALAAVLAASQAENSVSRLTLDMAQRVLMKFKVRNAKKTPWKLKWKLSLKYAHLVPGS